MPIFLDGVKTGGGSGSISSADLQSVDSGLSFTGGFTDRTTGTAGVSDLGSNVSYTSAQAAAKTWRVFGIDIASQAANDSIYWTEPDTASISGYDATKGLFGGTQLPTGVDQLFKFNSLEFATGGSLANGDPYTTASGSLDFSTCKIGDKLELRFDFNLVPQIANTTVEVALIWVTRDSLDNPTFSFSLAAQPVFYGTGSVGQTYLNRPVITAYFASDEDVNAIALPAVRADNQVQIQPLTMLAAIQR